MIMSVHSTPLVSRMDRPRTKTGKRSWVLVVSAVVLGASLLLLVTLRPAAPAVERSAVVIDTVTRGPFVHEIAAAGSLVAEQPRLIAAPVAGRVEAIRIQPGDRLRKSEIILELSNRDTVRQLLEVEQQVAGAEADLADLAATLQARSLESEKILRRTQFEKQDAERQAEATSELARQGLVSNLEAIRQREAAEEVAGRVITENRRHSALTRSAEAQLEAQRNRLERLRALHAFHRTVVDSLFVRAPTHTTVRDVVVQEGEWVTEGQRLVRLVEPGRLKAVLQVPEAAAPEVRVGQRVTMNARGTSLRGEISRLAAAVEQGTLAVEVRLEGDLSSHARPDLSVEGRIEIRRIPDALSISRAVNAISGAIAPLYKIDPNGRTARRTAVRYGPASVDRIVIVSGASAGDRFIIAGIDGQSEAVLRLK